MTKAAFVMMSMASSLSVAAAPVMLVQEPAQQPAARQPAVEQPAQPTTGQPAPSYSETELKSFAVAVLEVQKINNAYVPRFDAAGTKEEQQQVVEEAKHEVAEVIQKQGISIDRFQQILAHTQADDQLADKVRQLIKEAR